MKGHYPIRRTRLLPLSTLLNRRNIFQIFSAQHYITQLFFHHRSPLRTKMIYDIIMFASRTRRAFIKFNYTLIHAVIPYKTLSFKVKIPLSIRMSCELCNCNAKDEPYLFLRYAVFVARLKERVNSKRGGICT